MNLYELMQNPYAWAVLSICTIAALLFAVYTWCVGKKKKEFSCFYNTFAIVKAGKSIVPKLSLSYDGKSIDDLTVTKYAIWNSGNEVLNWADIVVASPLQIICNDKAKILDAKILVQSDETNMFKIIDKKDNCAKVVFDYANVDDGIILQILHTGEASDLNVECRIKGGKKLKNLNHKKKKDKDYKKQRKKSVILMGADVCLVCVCYVFMVLAEFGIISKESLNGIFFVDSTINGIFMLIMLLILIIIMLILYAITLKRVFYIGIPTKLRKNIEYDNYGNTSATKNQ